MSGLINLHLDNHVKESILENVIKDLTHLSETELVNIIAEL
jgi:hypothetical protein